MGGLAGSERGGKTELGMDRFEARKYPPVVRHPILTCISHLFLAEFWLAGRGKGTGPNDLSGTDGHASLFQPALPHNPHRKNVKDNI